MPVFKKGRQNSVNKKRDVIQSDLSKEKTPKSKKKIKIGFGTRHKKQKNTNTLKENKEGTNDYSEIQTESVEPLKQPKHDDTEQDIQDFLTESTQTDEPTIKKEIPTKETKEKEWEKTKKKNIIPRDMKGKPVFLEDTGEKIGIVTNSIVDKDNNLIGYKIKDIKSDSILSFPLSQFEEDKKGLIFVPSWYTKGMQTIEKLEFKDRISPELTWLIHDKTISTDELYKIFVKHDDKIASYIDEAVTLQELLDNRLRILEKERLSLKENLMDLTEKRLIKDLDRRKFSEIVMEHRRKVNILDVNINKCKELIERLEQTSYGMLSKNLSTRNSKEEISPNYVEEHENSYNTGSRDTFSDTYKKKYFDLKQQYEELQEEHNELKTAVEKILSKADL